MCQIQVEEILAEATRDVDLEPIPSLYEPDEAEIQRYIDEELVVPEFREVLINGSREDALNK